MRKVMEPVEVEAKDGKVWIVQPNTVGDGDDSIVISPDQVDTLIAWLSQRTSYPPKADA